MANNATVVDDDTVETDEGRKHEGLARQIAALGVSAGDRVEIIEGPDGPRLVQHTD